MPSVSVEVAVCGTGWITTNSDEPIKCGTQLCYDYGEAYWAGLYNNMPPYINKGYTTGVEPCCPMAELTLKIDSCPRTWAGN